MIGFLKDVGWLMLIIAIWAALSYAIIEVMWRIAKWRWRVRRTRERMRAETLQQLQMARNPKFQDWYDANILHPTYPQKGK